MGVRGEQVPGRQIHKALSIASLEQGHVERALPVIGPAPFALSPAGLELPGLRDKELRWAGYEYQVPTLASWAPAPRTLATMLRLQL